VSEPKPMKPLKSRKSSVFRANVEACDACGYWREDPELVRNTRRDGVSWPLYVSASHIADALYEIVISEATDILTKRSLFLCGHHYRKHEPFIATRGYIVREMVKK
jgi:hypothetical protein